MVAGIPSVSSDGRGNVYGCLCCVFSLAAVSGYTADIISVTKLCTCRSAADRPGSLSPSMCVCVYVCVEFVSGSPPPLAVVLLILERPRHGCDERLTSKEQPN